MYLVCNQIAYINFLEKLKKNDDSYRNLFLFPPFLHFIVLFIQKIFFWIVNSLKYVFDACKTNLNSKHSHYKWQHDELSHLVDAVNDCFPEEEATFSFYERVRELDQKISALNSGTEIFITILSCFQLEMQRRLEKQVKQLEQNIENAYSLLKQSPELEQCVSNCSVVVFEMRAQKISLFEFICRKYQKLHGQENWMLKQKKRVEMQIKLNVLRHQFLQIQEESNCQIYELSSESEEITTKHLYLKELNNAICDSKNEIINLHEEIMESYRAFVDEQLWALGQDLRDAENNEKRVVLDQFCFVEKENAEQLVRAFHSLDRLKLHSILWNIHVVRLLIIQSHHAIFVILDNIWNLCIK